MVKSRLPLRLALLAMALAEASLWLSPALAQGAGYDQATKNEIRQVVSDQLAALGREDGKAAEAFATPAIKDKFPDPAKFLAMVKAHYAALLHPRTTTFGETAESPHGPLQTMTVVAADGTVWKAIYSFQRVDGAWRISGCGLERDGTQQEI